MNNFPISTWRLFGGSPDPAHPVPGARRDRRSPNGTGVGDTVRRGSPDPAHPVPGARRTAGLPTVPGLETFGRRSGKVGDHATTRSLAVLRPDRSLTRSSSINTCQDPRAEPLSHERNRASVTSQPTTRSGCSLVRYEVAATYAAFTSQSVESNSGVLARPAAPRLQAPRADAASPGARRDRPCEPGRANDRYCRAAARPSGGRSVCRAVSGLLPGQAEGRQLLPGHVRGRPPGRRPDRPTADPHPRAAQGRLLRPVHLCGRLSGRPAILPGVKRGGPASGRSGPDPGRDRLADRVRGCKCCSATTRGRLRGCSPAR